MRDPRAEEKGRQEGERDGAESLKITRSFMNTPATTSPADVRPAAPLRCPRPSRVPETEQYDKESNLSRVTHDMAEIPRPPTQDPREEIPKCRGTATKTNSNHRSSQQSAQREHVPNRSTKHAPGSTLPDVVSIESVSPLRIDTAPTSC